MANAHLDDEAQIRQGIERAKFVQKGMKHPSPPPSSSSPQGTPPLTLEQRAEIEAL